MQRVPLHPGGRHSKKKKPGHGGWWKRPHSKKPKKNKEKDQEYAATPLHDDKLHRSTSRTAAAARTGRFASFAGGASRITLGTSSPTLSADPRFLSSLASYDVEHCFVCIHRAPCSPAGGVVPQLAGLLGGAVQVDPGLAHLTPRRLLSPLGTKM